MACDSVRNSHATESLTSRRYCSIVTLIDSRGRSLVSEPKGSSISPPISSMPNRIGAGGTQSLNHWSRRRRTFGETGGVRDRRLKSAATINCRSAENTCNPVEPAQFRAPRGAGIAAVELANCIGFVRRRAMTLDGLPTRTGSLRFPHHEHRVCRSASPARTNLDDSEAIRKETTCFQGATVTTLRGRAWVVAKTRPRKAVTALLLL